MAETTRLLIEKQWTLFVDGENFTRRGQEVLAEAGVKLYDDSAWRKDTFLWLPGVGATYPVVSPSSFWWSFRGESTGPPPPVAPPATRAYYYSSMVYAEPQWNQMRLTMRDHGFEPKLFRRREGKSKAVDIALATDVLTLAGESQYQVAVIFAGDGDYVPVVDAVKRLGRHVIVGFFAGDGHGLSDDLRIAADEFVDLEPRLIRDWTEYAKDREKAAREGVEGVAQLDAAKDGE